jgi:hypothetical protein
MKMLIIGLNLLGFEDMAIVISEKWQNLPIVANFQPGIYYQYGYPENLMKEIAQLIYEGLKNSGFSIISPIELTKCKEDSIIKLLNESWSEFWKKPDEFRKLEEEKIKKLKLSLDPKILLKN